MNEKTIEAGKKQLATLKERGVKVYSLEEAKNSGIVLATYGRSWFPENGESFEVPQDLVVCFYKRGKSNGVKFWAYSSKSGWDFYPIEPFAMLPDVKEERDILLDSPLNDSITLRGDGIEKVRAVQGTSFTVAVIKLHGPKWVTNEDGSRTRIPDTIDAKDRIPFDYYKMNLIN